MAPELSGTMTKTLRRMAPVFVTAGLILMAVTAGVFENLVDPSVRSPTYLFTKWYVIGQEAVLFLVLAAIASQSGRTETPIAVRGSYLTVTVLYNSVSLLTVLVFTAFLLPRQAASAVTYYTICAAETGLAVTLLVLTQVASIAQEGGHAEGEGARTKMRDISAAWRRIMIAADTSALPAAVAEALAGLGKELQFAEAPRRDPGLGTDIEMRLTYLEQLLTGGVDSAGLDEASEMIRELRAILRRSQ